MSLFKSKCMCLFMSVIAVAFKVFLILKYIKIILFLKIIFKINISKQFKTYKKINFYFFLNFFIQYGFTAFSNGDSKYRNKATFFIRRRKKVERKKISNFHGRGEEEVMAGARGAALRSLSWTIAKPPDNPLQLPSVVTTMDFTQATSFYSRIITILCVEKE